MDDSARPELGRSLTSFIRAYDNCHPGGPAGLLSALAQAVKSVAAQVSRGALVGTLGTAGSCNPDGDAQDKLDLISNEIILDHAERSGSLAAAASEEMKGIHRPISIAQRGGYLLLVDPLDGSSNLNVNITVGTIFSILRSPSGEPTVDDFLQPGTRQVVAGFALYGPATVLVLSTGAGVHGFTLDSDSDEFILTHPGMRIPPDTAEIAINASNQRHWHPPVLRYVKECLAGRSGPRGKDFNMRWVASLVAETFRILVRGGVFLYPADAREAYHNGRLRLLYEANPIAFIVEQAGGLASTGRERVLAVHPTTLHQRVPLVFGSSHEVERIERYHREGPMERAGFDASLFNSRSLLRL